MTLLFTLACGTSPTADGPADSSADSADRADTGEPGPATAALDQDGDGYRPMDGDCDDTLPHVYPGAPDFCDGLDQDCDGVADAVLWTNCLIPSSRYAEGGSFDYADVVGPCLGQYPGAELNGYLSTLTDMTGDGFPEWVFNDFYGAADGRNRVLIVRGFDIPWDDPSKW